MAKTQNQKIKEYLESGHKITPLEALDLFGCLRLGARIADLKKQGMDIETEIVHNKVTGKHYASYSLVAKVAPKTEPRFIEPEEIDCKIETEFPMTPDGELF